MKPFYAQLLCSVGNTDLRPHVVQLSAQVFKSVNAVIKSIRIDQKEHVIQLFSSLNMEAIELIAEKDSKASRLPVSNLNLPHGCILALVNHNGHIKIPSGDFQIMENDTVLIFCINSKIREVSKIFKSE